MSYSSLSVTLFFLMREILRRSETIVGGGGGFGGHFSGIREVSKGMRLVRYRYCLIENN